MGRIYQNRLQMRDPLYGFLCSAHSGPPLQRFLDHGARQFVQVRRRRLRTQIIPEMIDVSGIRRRAIVDASQNAQRHLHDLQVFFDVQRNNFNEFRDARSIGLRN